MLNAYNISSFSSVPLGHISSMKEYHFELNIYAWEDLHAYIVFLKMKHISHYENKHF